MLLVLLGSSLVACATAPAPSADGAAECVGCQPILDPPAVPPTSYRFEVETWEMPLARAEALYRSGDADTASIALVIDEHALADSLREIASHDRLVQHAARPAVTAPVGTRAVTARGAVASGDASWSDGLRLEFGASPTAGWSPQMLEFVCVWTSPQGERLAVAQGTTPMSPRHGVVVWCLPSKSLADVPPPRTARAIAAIVRVVPQS